MAGLANDLWRRHDHGSMGTIDMGSSDDDDMSVGTIDVYHFPVLYWEIVGAVLAAFTAANVIGWLQYRYRLRAARNNQASLSSPENVFTRTLNTSTSLFRELSNVALPALALPRLTSRLSTPTLGQTSLILGYFTMLIILCFYALDTTDPWEYESLAYRAGYVSLSQLPLVVLLAGKNNIIGLFTGHSYERLNWVHRWVSRCLFGTVTIHLGWWLTAWAPYDGFITEKITTDTLTKRGLAAWCILAWIIFSSFAPVRNLGYEFFVIQHLVSFVAFFVVVWYHVPVDQHKWIYIPVGFYVFDRLVRWSFLLYNNLSVFHKQRRERRLRQQYGSDKAEKEPAEVTAALSSSWANNAAFTPLAHNMTRITISNPAVTWKPGQHAFLSCHTLVPLQSHPFTICSLPSDNKLEFLVRAHRGASARYLAHAEKLLSLPTTNTNDLISRRTTVPVAIDGPYGNMRPLQQFDTAVLFAGSTGATFTVPLLRDIVRRWDQGDAVVTRRVRFVWAVKSREQVSWFARELADVLETVQKLRGMGKDVTVRIAVYVTCDEAFTADYNDHKRQRKLDRREQKEAEQKSSLHGGNGEDSKKAVDEIVAVREVGSSSPSNASTSSRAASSPKTDTADAQPKQKTSCGPNGTCCCRRVASSSSSSSSTAAATEEHICRCNDHAISSSTSSSSSTSPTRKPLLHERIRLHNGRPSPSSLINTELNFAQGETAVVSCGPRGMNADVRAATVKLSDARGVGKGGVAGLGTGSDGGGGVWFWGEGFGW